MFFARPLLISLSIAGLFPAALALPTTNTVTLDPCPDPATVEATIEFFWEALTNTTLAALRQGNFTAIHDIIKDALLSNCAFPANKNLTGTGDDAFTTYLRSGAGQ
ncbi:hypothetical protein MSAN_01311400 [Mycena sanguinolenta]|uniref:Uncharacterized protein n=1 Tax=Mycena sanguinolenta TaxID=230812 RepID=A0A8H6YDI5_9AGAR|nr:hypothetical protein MSAN_01311400 [Mycena sanguinolenta]